MNQQSQPISTELMTKNLNTPRMGAAPQVDVVRDLAPKPDYTTDSWFVIGRYAADGITMNYLYHVMALKLPVVGRRWFVATSVNVEETGSYRCVEHVYKDKDVTVAPHGFGLVMPNSEISGTWDDMRIRVHEDGLDIDTTTQAIAYPLLTRGSAVFEVLDMTVHQFSIPYLRTQGTITLDGTRHNVTDAGYAWFDRQWQHQGATADISWSWFALYMDNGDVLSIFDSGRPGGAFATCLKPDGTLVHTVNVPPFRSIESDYWKSPKTGHVYPTHWKLPLPDFDAELEIAPIIKEQEIDSGMKQLSRYEATSTVTGTYLGQHASGHGTVELLGSWEGMA